MAIELLYNEQDIQNKIEKEVDKKMTDFADLVLEFSQDNLTTVEIQHETVTSVGAIDEGTLLGSGKVEERFLEKDVVYTAPYAGAIEFGTDPGFLPNIGELEGWVKRKLGVPEKKVRSVTWAIAKSIQKDGLAPRSYMKGAVEKAIGVANSGGL